MPELAPAEIKALARIMDELDYYQLMHMKPGASPRELKESYYSTSRTFHPDANRHLEGELREAISEIAKRVTEAYAVLRDPQDYRRVLMHLGIAIDLTGGRLQDSRTGSLGKTQNIDRSMHICLHCLYRVQLVMDR